MCASAKYYIVPSSEKIRNLEKFTKRYNLGSQHAKAHIYQ